MAFSSALFSPVCFRTNQNPNLNHKFNKLNNRKILTVFALGADTFDGTTLSVIGRSSVAALVAAISLADPEKSLQLQAEGVGRGDKEVVKEYFNNNGFQRWKKMYGDTDEVNRVQLDIRIGHAKTVENVTKMLIDEGSLRGVSVCDAGCGIGCFSIPLAKEGAILSASDISTAMVAEAQKQVKSVYTYPLSSLFIIL